MAFTASQMEVAWSNLMATIDDTLFVNVVQNTTGEYYRLSLAAGTLYHWNRIQGTWDVTGTVPANLIAVNKDGRV